MIALLMKPEAAEECPCELILGVGNGAYALAFELNKRIAENSSDRVTRCPILRRSNEGDLDAWRMVLIEHRNGNDLAISLDADRHRWTKVFYSKSLTGPSL